MMKSKIESGIESEINMKNIKSIVEDRVYSRIQNKVIK